MSRPLYAITEELRNLFYEIEEAEGEITEEVDAALNIAQDQLETKIMSYYGVVKELEAKNIAVKEERARLQQSGDSNDRVISKLKSKILAAVSEFGYDGKTGNKKIDLATLKLWTVEREGVKVEDEEIFNDPRFCTVNVTFPSNFEQLKKIMDHAAKICTDEEREIIKTSNSKLVTSISRSRLSKALKIGTKVNGASLVKNSYVVMR